MVFSLIIERLAVADWTHMSVTHLRNRDLNLQNGLEISVPSDNFNLTKPYFESKSFQTHPIYPILIIKKGM